MKKLILILISILFVSCSTFGLEISDKSTIRFDMNSIDDLLSIHKIRGYPPLTTTKPDKDFDHVKYFCDYRLATLKKLAERENISWPMDMKTLHSGYFIPKDDPDSKVIVCLENKISDELAVEICNGLSMELISISEDHESFICKRRIY